MMRLHPAATRLIVRLYEAGFEGYAVGGCVRDALRGVTPRDWDVTTNATPVQVIAACSEWPVIPTGEVHGTVTVLIDETPVEVTTYRVDGSYRDHRHPDAVRFSTSLQEDLARRDFTVNAMACAPDGSIIDPFDGRRDLADGIIRCVGDPDHRFSEDALRILRALRFASTLSFGIEPKTAAAIHRFAGHLKAVSAERIYAELTAMLCGNNVGAVLTDFPDVLEAVIPEIVAMRRCPQRHPCHGEDVYAHTVLATAAAPADPVLRWTMLLHDCGKPLCHTTDAAGIDHFYGHEKKGAEMARQRLTALRADRKTIDAVGTLIERHGMVLPPTPPVIRRWLGRLGEEDLRRLTAVHRADAAGCNPAVREKKIHECDEWERALEDVIAAAPCVRRDQLAVNGRDLMALGIPAGPVLGDWLNRLLDEVIAGRLANDKETLIAYVKDAAH
ncbi:MAG: CCA tRNA nucleotidyltransferase [Acutalibacteraceae bacterium]|jgi:tRNA nucleotidyltransferase (CCA-adding enzyme)